MERRYGCAALVFLLILTTGALAQYPLRTSPANTVDKLAMAYEAMDLAAYVDCLAGPFAFYLCPDDLESNPELPEFWGRPTESVIHENMFSPTSPLESISAELAIIGSQHDAGADPADPWDDTWTLLVTTGIAFHFPNDLIRWLDTDQELVVRLDPDDEGPGGEELYEIIEWAEMSIWPRRVEPLTWSSMKYFFWTETPAETDSWTTIKALYDERS
jgi:hypothetical protein